MAITKHQVGIYMSSRNSGYTQETSAAKAGLSERTGRRIEGRGGQVASMPLRHWRTRQDPFITVWDSEVVPMLEEHPGLQALSLLEWLQERYPGQYLDPLLRTLQRRVKGWRAQYGPEKEVMFRQLHEPGWQGLSDFTELKGVSITLAGVPLSHRLYHFRLAYSGWCDVKVVLGGESYPALAEGLQRALKRLGGAPEEHRSDSLSAAFKNLSADTEADLTERYQALCAHYGMRATRNNPGRGHENGSIEAAHGHLKRRIEQGLKLRGSNDFEDLTAYQRFIDQVASQINRRNQVRITEELTTLQPLPSITVADYTELWARVTSSSTIQARLVTYTVPARLIGERLRVHLHDDRLVLFLGMTEVLTLPRVYPPKGKRRARRVDYRHLINWLVKKPMAFYRSQLRDDLLPTEIYHRIWHHLNQRLDPRQACKIMVCALQLAAVYDCEQALGEYWLKAINEGRFLSLVELQQRFGKSIQPIPEQRLEQHNLAAYDHLLGLNTPQSTTVQEVPGHA